MAIDLKQTAIDPDIEIPPTRNTKEAVRAVLGDLQGNILKSHGRDHSRHLIITFKTDTPEQRGKARAFLTGLVELGLVTSALQQWHEAQAYRDVKETIRGNGAIADKDVTALLKSVSETFVGVMLSADGYRALRLDECMPDDPSFLAGAKARVDVLKDAPVTQWEENFQGTFHALVIVADDVTERLEIRVAELKILLGDLCVRVGEETGTAMRLNANGEEDPSAPVREHFGFVDGVSQPLFYARDIDKARTLQGGIDQYDPSAPLDQVLVEDPGARTPATARTSCTASWNRTCRASARTRRSSPRGSPNTPTRRRPPPPRRTSPWPARTWSAGSRTEPPWWTARSRAWDPCRTTSPSTPTRTESAVPSRRTFARPTRGATSSANSVSPSPRSGRCGSSAGPSATAR
ncbi:hypothetical protein [Streptomyces bullii]